jgi:hypothetical protein
MLGVETEEQVYASIRFTMASRSDNENGRAPRPGPYRALSLSQHDLRRVAVAPCSDPRSVVAYLSRRTRSFDHASSR